MKVNSISLATVKGCFVRETADSSFSAEKEGPERSRRERTSRPSAASGTTFGHTVSPAITSNANNRPSANCEAAFVALRSILDPDLRVDEPAADVILER